MKRSAAILGLLFLLPVLTWGQGAVPKPWKKHEIFLGYGGAKSNEQHVFNVQSDWAGSPEGLVNLGYLYHFSPKGAVGIQGSGWMQTIKDVWVQDQNGNVRAYSFDLAVDNFGLQGRLIPVQGKVEPYVYLCANLTRGTLSNPDAGTLNISGTTFGGGGGANVFLGSHVTLGVEALALFGSANYEKQPFGNSTGKDFNPSIFGIMGQIAFRF